MTGLPFALFVLILLAWAVALLAGTLGTLDLPPEDDEGGEGEP